MTQSNTFCILPWTHVCVSTAGHVIPCCRYQAPKPNVSLDMLNDKGIQVLNTEDYKQIRTKMLKGEKIDQCKKCYFEEENNIYSYRNYSNDIFSKQDQIIDTVNFKQIRYIEISLDNICNLQCRMCSSRFSSKLNPRDQKLTQYDWNKHFYKVYKKLEVDYSFLDKEDLSELKEIKLLGGEPFMSPNLLKFLDFIIHRSNPQNITLFIASNGTHIPNQDILEKFKYFKTIKIIVSLDSFSKANDYQRYGSSYLEIWNNIKTYIELIPNLELGTHSVISLYNANKLDVTINHLESNNVYHRLDFVRNQEMSLEGAPEDYRLWLLEQNKGSQRAQDYIKNIISKCETNEKMWEMFLKNTKILDQYYNISLKDYNEELYYFLNTRYNYE